jgi:hypothetical protein
MPVTAADARTAAQLASLVRDGAQPKYLLFWGHQPPPGGGTGKGCLSQWWPQTFTVDGVAYPSAEHFMMAAKARLFGDEETARQILAAAHPGQAKALGRQVRGFDEEEWAGKRFDLVVTGNLAKFGQHLHLREFLVGTGKRVLVEASPLDRVWGHRTGRRSPACHRARTMARPEPARLRAHGGTPPAQHPARHRLLTTNSTPADGGPQAAPIAEYSLSPAGAA